MQQPAQSPDFNICDLAFFRALAVAVRKRRRSTMRGPKRFDIPTLVEDVDTAFEEYPPEQLETMWQHKLRHGCGADDETAGRRFELPAP